MSQDNISTANLPNLSGVYASMEIRELGDVTVYVNSDYEVYVENKRVLLWDNLMPEILNRNYDFGMKSIFISKVFFHIDKGVKYSFIDKIKEEISRLNKTLYGYIIADTGTPKVILDRNAGTIKEHWKGIIPNPKRDSVKMEFRNYKLPELNMRSNLTYQLKTPELLYAAKATDIDSILPIGKTVGITILPDRKMKFQGEILGLDNLEKIQILLKEGYLVLYTFHADLEYEDYIFFLGKKWELEIEKKEYQDTYGWFLEVSYSLAKQLEQFEYNFFDN